MQTTGFRNPYLFRYKVGFEEDGRITGIRVEIYSNAGNSFDVCGAVMDITMQSFDGPYKVPNWEVRGFVCKTNLPSNTAYRGFGNPESSVVMHAILEKVAERLGRDSFQVRNAEQR
jgi:xanthine dehydrogenase molybdopterin-binding subunit B